MACRDHVCRYEEGCGNVRKVKSNSQACDEHTCAAPKCYGVVGLRGKYCEAHTCIWVPCSKGGGVKGSPYCETHKCQTPTCQAPVMSKVDWFCERHKCRYSGLDCEGGWISSPPYCKDHTCAREDCNAAVVRGGEHCSAHTCKFIPRTTGEPLCLRGRRVGAPFCNAHSCDKCNKPRLPDKTRCASHLKLYPRDHPHFEDRRRRGSIAVAGAWTAPDEEQEGPAQDPASKRRPAARPRTPTPPRAVNPEQTMQLITKERGGLAAAATRLDLIPSDIRRDPNLALVYGHGFRDACDLMSDVMTRQMEAIAAERPLSPSRHVAKVDGPRFTTVLDDDV